MEASTSSGICSGATRSFSSPICIADLMASVLSAHVVPGTRCQTCRTVPCLHTGSCRVRQVLIPRRALPGPIRSPSRVLRSGSGNAGTSGQLQERQKNPSVPFRALEYSRKRCDRHCRVQRRSSHFRTRQCDRGHVPAGYTKETQAITQKRRRQIVRMKATRSRAGKVGISFMANKNHVLCMYKYDELPWHLAPSHASTPLAYLSKMGAQKRWGGGRRQYHTPCPEILPSLVLRAASKQNQQSWLVPKRNELRPGARLPTNACALLARRPTTMVQPRCRLDLLH